MPRDSVYNYATGARIPVSSGTPLSQEADLAAAESNAEAFPHLTALASALAHPPVYTHDCTPEKGCIYLGRFFDSGTVDLYVHRSSDGVGDTYIARRGSEGSNYESGSHFVRSLAVPDSSVSFKNARGEHSNSPHGAPSVLNEAHRRALARGIAIELPTQESIS